MPGKPLGFCCAIMFIAAVALAQTPVQDVGVAASSAFIGHWHQPMGHSRCRGLDAYEADFMLGPGQNGFLAGTYSIGCVNASGQFRTDGAAPYARVNGGRLTIALPAGTYTIDQHGQGQLVTEHSHYSLDMSKM